MRWTRLSAMTLALPSTTQKPTSLARTLAIGGYLFLLFCLKQQPVAHARQQGRAVGPGNVSSQGQSTVASPESAAYRDWRCIRRRDAHGPAKSRQWHLPWQD